MAAHYEDRFWTSSDGLSLHYRNYPGPEGSTALPVLCMHGLTRNARDFASLAEDLATKRRVIVTEMRGRGQSDYAKVSDSYTPAVYVGDVEKLLAELGITRFIAIGTSMGGLMTMLMAATAPGRMAAVVMNDIGPEVETAGLARISGYVGQGRSYPTWVHAARGLAEAHGAAFPDFDLDQWLEMAKRTMVVTQNGRISFDYDMAIAEPFAKPGNAAPPDLWLAYEALRDVPMLLVRGGLSDLLSEETVKQMGVRNPAMRAITVPRVGHAPTLDEPEVRAAIHALLDGVE
ncbi:MAG: alpha/beta hydrolase [Erythrobacter sp.]|jgi:pimeloyl-ACP methyl ester carboxylesterase|uniref:alpha/beta fold hydrolase n=1 Tax=Erythrobacter sp. TaxID=1042 RepID=UPI002B45FAF6|nr:alpha/beta hydrolase [Erythrobacter sp.]WRH70541.1 MAG: alpha/beta hydrolase [Erythrobacter sp.]